MEPSYVKHFSLLGGRESAHYFNLSSVFMTPDLQICWRPPPFYYICLNQTMDLEVTEKKMHAHEYTYLHTRLWQQRSLFNRKTVLKIKYNIQYMLLFWLKKKSIQLHGCSLENHQVFWPAWACVSFYCCFKLDNH